MPALDQVEPDPLLLFCPNDAGWIVGVWAKGAWRDRRHLDDVVHPTHWAPLPEEPGLGAWSVAEVIAWQLGRKRG